MTTTYLRFSDQPSWEDAAAMAGFRINTPKIVKEASLDEEAGEEIPAVYEDCWSWIYYNHDWAIDDIGILFNDDAIVDEDGMVITPATPMEGWHVNYIGALPDGWNQYLLAPQNPRRIFAGDDR